MLSGCKVKTVLIQWSCTQWLRYLMHSQSHADRQEALYSGGQLATSTENTTRGLCRRNQEEGRPDKNDYDVQTRMTTSRWEWQQYPDIMPGRWKDSSFSWGAWALVTNITSYDDDDTYLLQSGAAYKYIPKLQLKCNTLLLHLKKKESALFAPLAQSKLRWGMHRVHPLTLGVIMLVWFRFCYSSWIATAVFMLPTKESKDGLLAFHLKSKASDSDTSVTVSRTTIKVMQLNAARTVIWLGSKDGSCKADKPID